MFLITSRDGNIINLLQLYRELPENFEAKENTVTQIKSNKVFDLLYDWMSHNKQIKIVDDQYDVVDRETRYYGKYILKNGKKYITDVIAVDDKDQIYDQEFFIPLNKDVFDVLSKDDYLGIGGRYVKYDVPCVAFLDELEEHELMTEVKSDENLDIEMYGNLAVHKLRQFLDDRISGITILYLFKYIELNQILVEKGYIITDKNRQEKYIEIINTGDEALISVLTDYSEIYEELKQRENLFTTFKKFKEDVTFLSSKEEIDSLYQKVVDTFS